MVQSQVVDMAEVVVVIEVMPKAAGDMVEDTLQERKENIPWAGTGCRN